MSVDDIAIMVAVFLGLASVSLYPGPMAARDRVALLAIMLLWGGGMMVAL